MTCTCACNTFDGCSRFQYSMYEKPPHKDTRLAHLTGTRALAHVISDAGAFYIIFTSDGVINHGGFVLSWAPVTQAPVPTPVPTLVHLCLCIFLYIRMIENCGLHHSYEHTSTLSCCQYWLFSWNLPSICVGAHRTSNCLSDTCSNSIGTLCERNPLVCRFCIAVRWVCAFSSDNMLHVSTFSAQ